MKKLKMPAVRTGASIPATKVKNEFGRMFEKVLRGERVIITRHRTPKAVLISLEEFQALSLAGVTKMESLSAEFDSMLARMQSSVSKKAMASAFGASTEQLGKAALQAAQTKRG
jgi:antitoxin Phd